MRDTFDGRVSIHAPREGRDFRDTAKAKGAGLFQSTRPVKGATSRRATSSTGASFQSTRPVKGATHRNLAGRRDGEVVSIHAPREGRDHMKTVYKTKGREFQSTRPVKGATWRLLAALEAVEFQSTRPVKGATNGEAGAASVAAVSNPRAP